MSQPRDALRTLIETLGGGPLPGLERLEAGELQLLVDAVRHARHQQQRQLAQAIEAALGHLPALLRAPVRRILLPQ